MVGRFWIFFRKAEGKVGCFVVFGLEDAPPKDTLRRRLPLGLAQNLP